MKLNAILILSILVATSTILLSALFHKRLIVRPQAAPLSSTILRTKILLDPERPLLFSSPSAPLVADFVPAYPGKEIAYVTQNGDLYIYSADFVYIQSTKFNRLSPTPTPSSATPIIYTILRSTDTTPTALFTKRIRIRNTTGTFDYNELVGIASVDPQNPQDQLRINTEFLRNE